MTSSSLDSDKNIKDPNHRGPLQRQLARSIIRSASAQRGGSNYVTRTPATRTSTALARPAVSAEPGLPGWSSALPAEPRVGEGVQPGWRSAPSLSPVRAPPLQEGPGWGHRPVTETENGAENPNQPFVHTKPKQQRRPTHPEKQTPELSPPLPPSPPRPPPPRLSRRLVTRSEGPQIKRPEGYKSPPATPPPLLTSPPPARPEGIFVLNLRTRSFAPPSPPEPSNRNACEKVPVQSLTRSKRLWAGFSPPSEPVAGRPAGQGPLAAREASPPGRERSERLKYSRCSVTVC